MKRPTQEQVQAEIEALKKLKPFGPFRAKTERAIEIAIEALKYGFDQTADEWNELDDEQQDTVFQAEGWKTGDIKDRPSTGWEGLAK